MQPGFEKTNPSPDLTHTASRSKWAVLVAVGLGTFMSALDISVINLILPEIQKTFSSSIAAVEWVALIYLLLVSGLLLSFGRFGDLYGHRRVYLAGFLGFVVSSVLCGLAPSTLALVFFRAAQALGAAMLSANSPAILTKTFPTHQRGQALGLQATMTYLGLTVGPFAGGWLTEILNWRAVFFINIPVGLAALGLSYRFVPHDRPDRQTETFDLAGAVLFMGGLSSLLLALNQGSSWGWNSSPVLILLALAAVLLILFLRLEARLPAPMLDLSLFSNRVFSASTLSAVLNYICVYSILFLMPFYLLNGRDLSASQSGSILSVMPLIMAVLAPISGTVSDSIGARIPATLGMLGITSGMILLSRLNQNSSLAEIRIALLVAGAGIGTFISPNTSALLGAAPRKRQGIAAGILATARNVGMVLGIGLSGAIFTTVLGQHFSASGPQLYQAVQTSFSVAIGFALLGLLISAIFGDTPKT